MSGELTQRRPAVVLLVEDNDNDVELTRHGFRRSKWAVNLHHAKDGVECMAFLRKQGDYHDAPTPDLILLDLNMPRMDGRQVLAEVVADTTLAHLPMVILTTSAEEREILTMYRHRCNSYIVKPIDFDQFVQMMRLLGEYWFTLVTLPTQERLALSD